jgi:trehalose 6-phosphate phosphatase
MSGEWGALEGALEALVEAPTLLIALDFDGVLAPLVDNPDDSRITPEGRSALNALTELVGVHVALVSGRGLANLRTVSRADERWWMVGSHGIEVEAPANAGSLSVPTANADDLQAVWDDFVSVAEQFPGTWVETKPWGAALHTRSLDSDTEERVRAAARERIARYGDALTTRLGHGIIESSLQSQTKGDGVSALMREIEPSCTLFMGDDVTDEDALAVLSDSDVGVKVGLQPSVARYRLETIPEVAQFLMQIAQRRANT